MTHDVSPTQPLTRCTAETAVPALIVEWAHSATAVPGTESVTHMRCALAAHDSSEHQGLVRVLSGESGGVWAVFTDALPPWRVRIVPRCPRLTEGERCGIFVHHPGNCLPPSPDAPPRP